MPATPSPGLDREMRQVKSFITGRGAYLQAALVEHQGHHLVIGGGLVQCFNRDRQSILDARRGRCRNCDLMKQAVLRQGFLGLPEQGRIPDSNSQLIRQNLQYLNFIR